MVGSSRVKYSHGRAIVRRKRKGDTDWLTLSPVIPSFPDQFQVKLCPLSLGAKGTSCLSSLPSPTAQGSKERHRSSRNEELARE